MAKKKSTNKAAAPAAEITSAAPTKTKATTSPKTQAEVDAAIAAYPDGTTAIDLSGLEDDATAIVTGAATPWFTASGSSQPRVEAYGSSQPRVEAYGSSQPRVEAYDSSQPRVEAYDSSQPRVEASGYSQLAVESRGNPSPAPPASCPARTRTRAGRRSSSIARRRSSWPGPVAIADIVVHANATYPQKVKAPKLCGPCYEVDEDGERIAAPAAIEPEPAAVAS